MAVTVSHLTGFEHGLATAGVDGPFDDGNGSPIASTGVVRTGARALETESTSEGQNVAFSTTSRTVTSAFYVFFQALPDEDSTVIAYTLVSGGNNGVLQYDTTTGKLELTLGAGSTPAVVGPVIATSTWYRVVMELDSTANPRRLRSTIGNGTEVEVTNAVAAADTITTHLGQDTNYGTVSTVNYDDWVVSETNGDYEQMRDDWVSHHVEGLIPTGDGTHSAGADEIERTLTGTDIVPGTTTAFQLVDDVPMDVAATDFINDVGTSTTAYAEVTFDDLAAGVDTPVSVRAYEVDSESSDTGGSAAISRVVLSDGTSVAPDLRLSTDDPGLTVTMRKKTLTGVTWDRTNVNGLKARMGFGDGAPDAFFSGIMLEVALFEVEAPTGPPYLVNSGARWK
jgi:hypothetical protein